MADREQICVGGVSPDVRFKDVVRPNGVESGDITRHPGHEARQERRETKSQHAAWKIVQEHVGYHHVVVKHHLAAFVFDDFSGLRVRLGRDHAFLHGLHLESLWALVWLVG